MDAKVKMTKQAVRDLNHLGPKKRPPALAPESPPVGEAELVARQPAAPQSPSLPPIVS